MKAGDRRVCRIRGTDSSTNKTEKDGGMGHGIIGIDETTVFL